jgi:hypothetical protein
MAYLTDEQLEAQAVSLRERLGLAVDCVITWSDLVPRLERAFPGLRLLAVPDEEMPYPGEADPENNRIKMRQTAYNQLKAGSAWALETLVHELCHFQLGHRGVHHRRGGRDHSRQNADDEKQTHLLAKAVIAPAAAAMGIRSADELAQKFNLTKASAAKRWEMLERLMRRKDGRPRELPSNVVDFLLAGRARGLKIKSLEP